MLTCPKVFLAMPDTCGLWPCNQTHLKNGLVPDLYVGGAYDKYHSIWVLATHNTRWAWVQDYWRRLLRKEKEYLPRDSYCSWSTYADTTVYERLYQAWTENHWCLQNLKKKLIPRILFVVEEAYHPPPSFSLLFYDISRLCIKKIMLNIFEISMNSEILTIATYPVESKYHDYFPNCTSST